jgi:hypothetical protein
MKARMRNGKVIEGRVAEIFIDLGIAESLEDQPEVKDTQPKVTHKKRSASKKRGRPAKRKK